jgi:hypothetical protein
MPERRYSISMLNEYPQDRYVANTGRPKTDPSPPIAYEIKIEGHLSEQWTAWFGGLTITLEEDGETLISGVVTGQAALYGLLKKVRDLGMPLISVKRIQPGQAGAMNT